MIFPSTPKNGIIIIIVGLLISIPFYFCAYILHNKGVKELKEILPKKKGGKVLTYVGIAIVIVGFGVIISQLDFKKADPLPVPPPQPPQPSNTTPTPTAKPTSVAPAQQFSPASPGATEFAGRPPESDTVRIPTADEIAEALKKKIPPFIGDEVTKHLPDLTKAKRETHIVSIDEFEPNANGKLKVDIPGYFELSTNSSHVILMTRQKFDGHYYASVQMGALENVRTMDLMGDISICLAPAWQGFFIWESEKHQRGWFAIEIKQKMHPIMNTVSVYQKGMNVSVFINNEFVGGFVRQKPPSQRQVGIGLKAGQAGGKMGFQSFAVWEFEKPSLQAKRESTAIMIEGGEGNVIERSHIQGFDRGIVGKDTKDLKIIDTDIKK